MAVQPLGIVTTGYLIEGLGLQPTVLLIAVSLQVLGVAMLFLPAFRTMGQPTLTTEISRREPVGQQ